MKKIVLYVLILVLPAVVVFLGLNIAYKKTNHWKAQYYNSDRFNHVPSGIKLCNVGTSHGCWGFKWEDYPELNAFNFANGNQPFYMDLIVLKHFESKIENSAIVLIPISFHQVYSYWASGVPELYYCFLKKTEYPFWNTKIYIKMILFPLLNNTSNIRFIKNDITENEMDRFHFGGWKSAHLSEQAMKNLVDSSAANWFYCSDAPFNTASYSLNFDAACKIVDYCHAHGWKPIFITVPVYSYFYEFFEEMEPYIKKGFYQFSAELTEKYPDIPYWDYSNDEEFSPNIELFADDDHLNVYGAEKFTARIIADLREAGYLE